MRIALSASYWDCPPVRDILRSCEYIFTTQVRCRDSLYREFGVTKVKFIPFSTEAMFEAVLDHFPVETEVLRYSDLHRIAEKYRYEVIEKELAKI